MVRPRSIPQSATTPVEFMTSSRWFKRSWVFNIKGKHNFTLQNDTIDNLEIRQEYFWRPAATVCELGACNNWRVSWHVPLQSVCWIDFSRFSWLQLNSACNCWCQSQHTLKKAQACAGSSTRGMSLHFAHQSCIRNFNSWNIRHHSKEWINRSWLYEYYIYYDIL